MFDLSITKYLFNVKYKHGNVLSEDHGRKHKRKNRDHAHKDLLPCLKKTILRQDSEKGELLTTVL